MKTTGLKIISLLLLVISLMAVLPAPAGTIRADDESSVDANVTVNEVSQISYGFRVMAFRNVVLPWWILGKPDRFNAFLFRNAWIEVKLKDTIEDCQEIDIWAASMGWQKSQFTVYTSENGKKWKKAGSIKVIRSFVDQYSLTGSFGNVGYIKLDRNGSVWSFGAIDAVCAKGGD
jgi:hypothetical protein